MQELSSIEAALTYSSSRANHRGKKRKKQEEKTTPIFLDGMCSANNHRRQQQRRRRGRHALSVFRSLRSHLASCQAANDVTVNCADGIFHTNALILAAMSPTLLAPGLLDAFANYDDRPMCVIAPHLSVEDVRIFFDRLFGCCAVDPATDLPALRRVTSGLGVWDQQLPESIFTSFSATGPCSKETTLVPLSSPEESETSSSFAFAEEEEEMTTYTTTAIEINPCAYYICEYCSETFLSRSGLESHMQSSHGVPLRTSLSGSSSFDLDGDDFSDGGTGPPPPPPSSAPSLSQQPPLSLQPLQAQTSPPYVRTDVKPLLVSCLYCPSQFQGCQALRTHIRACHPARALSCLMCGHRHESARELFQHIQTHVDDPANIFFPCKHCGMNFSVRYDLRTHIRRAHYHRGTNSRESMVAASSTNPFRCVDCGESGFESSRALAAHVEAEHGDGERGGGGNGRGSSRRGRGIGVGGNSNGRLHPCPHCDKTFRYYGLLERHVRAHLGARSFVCELCGKGFFDSDRLKEHRKVHVSSGQAGEKVYGCDLCDQVFLVKSLLLRHLRSETHRQNEANQAVKAIIGGAATESKGGSNFLEEMEEDTEDGRNDEGRGGGEAENGFGENFSLDLEEVAST